MYAAAFNENPEVLRVLLSAGADLHVKDKDGGTALMYAAVDNENPEVLRVLLSAGADASVKNNSGCDAVCFVRKNKYISDSDRIIMMNILTNAPMSTQKFLNLCMKGSPEEIRKALETGVNINVKDANGKTALFYAASKNSDPHVIITLLDAGADANLVNNEGKRAIDYAEKNDALKDTEALCMLRNASGQ